MSELNYPALFEVVRLEYGKAVNLLRKLNGGV